jgi:hypothetical protein
MKKEVSEANFVPSKVNIDSLIHCAIYLSGLKDGKGNLLPLGTIVLDDLWNAIKYLQGDIRYCAERDNLTKEDENK